ncbi:MAG: hypothetical protein ACK51V_02435 [bacterium]|nr:hypothetical protein [Rhodocyclaceae bacterium]MCE2722573.1 hypothetical protein [Betaproteobacteria bacterium]MCA3025672.1 hypothetical protein [Rhodocyclaceae bacterium]MCA3048033.1 hypothetical protein [Rhodocyclaceae bacterium]MCA3050466.1 hypothetical protein [Rhodocyclaceae bacterium]
MTKRIGLAVLMVLLVGVLVFAYAALGTGIRSWQQVISLGTGALFLCALLALKPERLNAWLWLIYLIVGSAVGGAWIHIWALSSDRAMILLVVTVALSASSRVWLRAL